MSNLRSRPVALVAAMTVLPLGLTGCGLSGDDPEPVRTGPVEVDDGAHEPRQVVRGYLNAMLAKDATTGRGRFCAVAHETFDRAATGPNGDFAAHFTVTRADIVDVRPGDTAQEVRTAITVDSGGTTIERRLLFVVARTDGGWCIADERSDDDTPDPPAGPVAPATGDPG
jgi:hypothetical protein